MSGIAVRVLSTGVERSLPLLSAPDGVVAYATWNTETKADCVGREEGSIVWAMLRCAWKRNHTLPVVVLMLDEERAGMLSMIPESRRNLGYGKTASGATRCDSRGRLARSAERNQGRRTR